MARADKLEIESTPSPLLRRTGGSPRRHSQGAGTPLSRAAAARIADKSPITAIDGAPRRLASAAPALRITSDPTPAGSPMLIANSGGVFRLARVLI